ncbi:protein dispatched [Condylostylus longicornis]|uniref:protein dispatched n=1 Tax=Condylostylus longicornis TaxID=2530218 RepID=UPI00244E1A7B|nr:protein dispatched [Condylostylus longicornis]XP_055384765.1 protein dispatched [Condylostylus longicornis]
MAWYYKFLVRRPYLVVLAIAILSLACIIVSLTTKDLPDFSNPTLGFEARGTSISQRLTAWHNLLEETRVGGKLADDPSDLGRIKILNGKVHKLREFKNKGGKRKSKKERKKQLREKIKKLNRFKNEFKYSYDSGFQEIHFKDYETIDDNFDTRLKNKSYEFGYNRSSIDEDEKQNMVQSKISKWNLFKHQQPPALYTDMPTLTDGFFCGSPTIGYAHFVVKRIGPNSTDSIFEINSLLAMCQLEEQIQSVEGYEDFCEKDNFSDQCCRPWSISNYVALLSNKSSCFDITNEDVLNVLNLLSICFEYFNNFKLSSDCNENLNCHVPVDCVKYNAVFNIFHYLTDVNFMKTNESKEFLKYAMIFVPVARSTTILSLFHKIEEADLKNDLTMVAAMDLGLKNALFDEMLIADGWLVALGLIFVTMCMWIFTSSLIVTIMTLIAVLFSLGLAYFIYTLIFEITFFPFMNILAVIVIIGIGADDAFIFVKIWQSTLAEKIQKGDSATSPVGASTSSFNEPDYSETLNFLMETTFRHAAISMFVTSLTTAGAFYTSVVSSITSVKCFGIFAGTAIVSNYLLMVTWLPASVSIMERVSCHLGNFLSPNIISKFRKSIKTFGSIVEDYVLNAVLKMPYLWIVLFGFIGVFSFVIVLYWPSLQLPNTADFQLFISDHPFEAYDAQFKDLFWFEKLATAIDNPKLPLRFVWGIKPVDDGDFLNPYSRGELYFDNNFNVSDVESQVWLLNFCRKLKQESFYGIPTFGVLLPNCFIENFITWMDRKCLDRMDNADRTPCCEISKFPFRPDIFEYCLPLSISSLYSSPRHIFLPGVAGPKFSPSTHVNQNKLATKEGNVTVYKNYDLYEMNNTNVFPQVKAVVIEFDSNFTYTMSYSEVKHFFELTQSWFNREIVNAPASMQGGWFISELDFFDLQDTLSKGTILSIAIAMCASLLVLLTVTLNVLISIYAVVTVTFTIFVTVAILILFGWRLNILESVSVSTAIGLAVDFSLHYGIHYRLSPNGDRLSSTIFSLSRIIGPTSMAALTTGIAGAIMLASNVLPYIQIGVFLVVVMSVSWLYSTFFLMSLLKLFGPQYGFMQFSYPKWKNNSKTHNTVKTANERKESHVNVTEQLLTPSSSAVGELVQSESHELDSLTSNSLVKTISDLHRSSIDFEHIYNKKFKEIPSPSTGSAVTVVLSEDANAKV